MGVEDRIAVGDRDRDLGIVVVIVFQLLKLGDQLLNLRERFVGQDHHKLVAANAELHRVGEGFADQTRGGNDILVALAVAVNVVDALQSVKVKHHHAKAERLALLQADVKLCNGTNVGGAVFH